MIFDPRGHPQPDELGKLAQDFNQLASTLEKPADAPRFYGRHFHELRTPLAVLRGELEAIQDGVRQFTPSPGGLALQAEVGTLTKLVDDLHQLSMSDEGARLTRKHRSMINILPRDRRIPRALLPAVTWKINLRCRTVRWCSARDRLMQLFNNLLENSLLHRLAAARLQHISGRQENGRFAPDFADSAHGVKDAQLKNCSSASIAPKVHATAPAAVPAFGLAICLNIVGYHGGTHPRRPFAFWRVSITVELPLERDLSREA